MMWGTRVRYGTLAFALCAWGCDDGGMDDDGGDTDGDEGMVYACGDLVDEDDLAACSPNANDYQPGGDDAYEACVTDDGTYTLVDSTPSSIARVEAYEEVLTMLAADPSQAGFTAARTKYSEDEGLESRLQRREDLHYPEIPMSDWDPGVDSDKQCTVASNVEKYAERCAGPSSIAPIMNEAFAAGQNGEGEPAVHIARIEAAGLWFLYLSVYKEANTCFTSKAKDCDSAWAYYTGGFDRGGGIGMAADVLAVSQEAHDAIWDGFSAFRCLRDLNPADESPSIGDLDMDAQGLLCSAQSQLTTALDHGLAMVVRARLEAFAGLEGAEAEAAWAGLEIIGPVLDRAGNERDAAAYASLQSFWTAGQPTDVSDAIATLDAVFTCP
ncbi:MAG: hypothetical protein ACE37F_29760 [Nannocystaceae bacterium]|nr:hypothetical protein [bacterium]